TYGKRGFGNGHSAVRFPQLFFVGRGCFRQSADCYRNVFSEKWRYSYRVGKSNFCLVERKGTRLETGGFVCQSDRRNIFLKMRKSIVNMLLFDNVISSKK